MMIITKRRICPLSRTLLSFSKSHGSRNLTAIRIHHSQPFEEERLPFYDADQFYPVRIGEILNSQYKVVGKLGYGAYSTVWLCRDMKRDSGYVAVKVGIRDEIGSPRRNNDDRELKFYEHLISLDSRHSGQAYIRGLLGEFRIDGPTGRHLCLVQPPMHMTIHEFQRINSSKRLNQKLLNWTLFNLLNALSFLHEEAGVIHTDINPSNIMLTINDNSLLTKFEQAEIEDPSPTKPIDETRTIYGSRKLDLPQEGNLWGQPVLCDFGEARIGQPHKGLIQPEQYRAPEVLFDMEWGSSVDIWSVAALIWDLFEGRHLFHRAQDEAQKSSSKSHHIAEMIGYLGTPPLEYLRRSESTKNFFNEQGHWKSAGGVEVPETSLEQAETVLDGEEKTRFLSFVRSMLRWVPEERRRANELLKDPWMEGAIF